MEMYLRLCEDAYLGMRERPVKPHVQTHRAGLRYARLVALSMAATMMETAASRLGALPPQHCMQKALPSSPAA
eukprot:17197-Eustigmatos_ZCMA.PRE.1